MRLTVAWLMIGVTGKYFNPDKSMVESSPASHDVELSKHVWKVSTEMAGLLPHEQINSGT